MKQLKLILMFIVMVGAGYVSHGQAISGVTLYGSEFCAGGPMTVSFAITGTFNSTNVFKVQLSSATGVFPGTTLSPTSKTSPMTVTIPANTAAGTGYKVRVISTSPSTTGPDNGSAFKILAAGSCGPVARGQYNNVALTTSIPSVSTPLDVGLSINSVGTTYYPSISFLMANTSLASGIFGNTYNGGINVAVPGIGNFAPVFASAFNVISDRRMKKGITEITSENYPNYMEQIRKIESATFRYNHETEKSRPVPHLGVIAQSLPPEVQAHVSENPAKAGEERLGVSLADMQGLLLVGIKALDKKTSELEAMMTAKDEQIAKQQKQIDELTARFNQMQKNGSLAISVTEEASRAVLGQNVPNPSSNGTLIPFSLPADCNNAVIKITDMGGKIVRTISLIGKGSNVSVDAGSLASGTYSYTLFIDGKAVDTKKMTLTK